MDGVQCREGGAVPEVNEKLADHRADATECAAVEMVAGKEEQEMDIQQNVETPHQGSPPETDNLHGARQETFGARGQGEVADLMREVGTRAAELAGRCIGILPPIIIRGLAEAGQSDVASISPTPLTREQLFEKAAGSLADGRIDPKEERFLRNMAVVALKSEGQEGLSRLVKQINGALNKQGSPYYVKTLGEGSSQRLALLKPKPFVIGGIHGAQEIDSVKLFKSIRKLGN